VKGSIRRRLPHRGRQQRAIKGPPGRKKLRTLRSRPLRDGVAYVR